MAAKTGPQLVGLDIGTTGIRAVEVKWHSRAGAYRISKVATMDLPRGAVSNGMIVDSRVVAKALKKLWRTGHFSTRKVAFGLADSSVLTRQIELPWMQTDDFRTALQYQVADVLPVDRTTVQLDYHLLGEDHRLDDNQQPMDVNRILLVAANTESITAQTDVLRKAKLEPVVADSAAFALIRAACQGILPPTGEAHAIVDLGADQMTVVVHQGGQPRFIRTITSLGGANATEAVAERLRIEPEAAELLKRETGLNGPAPVVAPIAESSVFRDTTADSAPQVNARTAATVEVLNPWATSVIGEIRNSLDYFQASDPGSIIQTLTITGRTAKLDGFLERVATQIPLPVRMMDPLLGLETPGKVRKNHAADTRLVVAAGLAMGARA
jgi:type IV pilus assembly protein PilM